ncbi:hypothetical protein GDO78_015385 [Eleutherodactylus coqui]|uniref:Kinetochore protein NDC80 n=1 Tax=Eleutherodactylus coqui TaxID=57060 RepID=A0A8J6JP93_ELECQ|nr:hypothetical protein GDO78_015385 [Eleutherodactylus coqui]
MRRSSVTNRQSLQPLRVQDTNRMGLTTPQAKDRLSKLSMPKTHSGTSERKTSFFGKRASGNRNSQFGAFGASEKIKDPRPLHDKSFIQQCIRQLCEFLNENGYSQTLTVKSLQGPSSKDFLKIFAFIYSFICPNYEIPDSKFEEEIPRVFKELGYPFALSKSSMYTVGAPHTWPQIVAALVWLIDCIKVSCVLKGDDHVFEELQVSEPSEDGIDFNQLFLDYTVKCYQQFMEGRDTFEDNDSEVYSKLKDLYAVEESHVDSLQAEARRLMEEIERLEKDKEREPREVCICSLVCRLLSRSRQLWSTSCCSSKYSNVVETQIAEFHKVARKVRLIPSTAENANGYDFQIECNMDSEQGGLNICRNKINLHSLIGEKRNDTKSHKEEAQKLEETSIQKAEEADEVEKRWTSEIESLEKHRHLLESGHQTEEEMRQVGNKLVRVVTAVASHMAAIEKHLEEKRLKTEREYEEFKREDLLLDLRELLAKYKEKAKALQKRPGK